MFHLPVADGFGAIATRARSPGPFTLVRRSDRHCRFQLVLDGDPFQGSGYGDQARRVGGDNEIDDLEMIETPLSDDVARWILRFFVSLEVSL